MTSSTTHREKFQNRVIIRGKLTLTSDLTIGDGWIRVDGQDDRSAGVATVAVDVNEQPFIPGSALKGVLRHYLLKCDVAQPLVDSVFGKSASEKSIRRQELSDDELGTGGAVVFCDSHLEPDSGECGLHTITNVGIDRITRTASDRILFQRESVSVGAAFGVCIETRDLSDEQVGMILRALEGFDKNRIRLGANSSDFGGTASWQIGPVTRIDRNLLKTWWNQSPTAQEFLKSWRTQFTADDRSDVIRQYEDAFSVARLKPPIHLVLDVLLAFDGPFLVNDPERSRLETSPHSPDMTPRLTTDGKLLLPASSFRGALRFQAERICRSLGKACIDPHRKSPNVDTNSSFASLFGVTSRRAALEVSDFLELKPSQYECRTFVAIDRFTGGSARGDENIETARRGGKLYKIRYAVKPQLKGQIVLDLAKLAGPACGLLALTIRDLIEGDIILGYGASKGFGHCTAHVSYGFPRSDSQFDEFQDWLIGVSKEYHKSVSRESIAQTDLYRPIVNDWVSQFRAS